MTSPPSRRPPSRPMQRVSQSLPLIDHDLVAAARRVLDDALAVVFGERIVVVVDNASATFALALADQAVLKGASAQVFTMEALGPRPHRCLHRSVRDALAQAQVSVLHISLHQSELAMRSEFVDLASVLRIRHAHMVGVTRTSMIAGLSADPRRIAEVSRQLRMRIRSSSELSVRSQAGTQMSVSIEPWCRWYETSGLIRPGAKANLPAGELVTSPAAVQGVYVANGWIADGSGIANQSLATAPLHLEIEHGYVRKIEGRDIALVRRLTHMIEQTSNLDRVGLISFGTNIGMIGLADDIFTNQKLPSLHLSLGLPFPDRTGAPWSASEWIAFTAVGSDVDIDGVPVMRSGRYLVG